MILFGIILWIIPFLVAFLFMDASGNTTISEVFFKTIMIVVANLVAIPLAVMYFKDVRMSFVKEGIILGLVWLTINWGIDLALVFAGFFPMTITQYFTDIGLRYLVGLFMTVGIGYALKQKQ